MDGETTADAPASGGAVGKGRVGIIDVGSNSIRLVVYERASRAPLPVFNEKVLCGLARGLDATGRLNPEGVEMALANIDRFTTLAHNMKVTSLDLLATAAVRDAADGADFMRELERRPGIKAHIVSGQDEARFSGYGVICGMPDASGVMGDLGGGSLELVALEQGRLGASSTLPVGPLRLMSSGKSDPKRAVLDAIESVRWLREETGKTFYAVGGAWRSFARLHMEQAGYPLHIIHHYEIAAEEARAVARLIAVQSAKSLEKMPGVSRRRVDTLPLACLALDRLLAALKPKTVVFSAFGLREGFYYSRLSEAERGAPSADRLRRGAGRGLAPLRSLAFGDLRLAEPGLRRRERRRPGAAHRRLPSQRHLVERPSRLPRRPGLCPRAPSAGAGHEPSRARHPRDGARLPLQERPQVGDARHRAQAVGRQGTDLCPSPRRLPQAGLQPLRRRARPAAADPAAPHRSRAAADRAARRQGQPGRRHGPPPRKRGRGVRPQVDDRDGSSRQALRRGLVSRPAESE